MDRLRRIFDSVSRVGNIIAGVFLAGIAFLMTGDVIGRYVFDSPIVGTFEMVTAAMAVLATIGFAFALEQNRHIRATVLVGRFSTKAQHGMVLLAYFLGFIVTGVLSWQLLLSAGRSIAIGEFAPGFLKVPMYVPRVIFLFAVALFCLGFLLRFIEGFRKPR